MEREYPKKVLAIYEAVGSLMLSGKDMDKLKVSDITKEAGIGKGTAYEYFDSKEEIISKGICYHMHQMLMRAESALESEKTLKGQIRKLSEWFEEGISAKLMYSFFKLQMKESDDAADIRKRVSELAQIRDDFFGKMADILIEAGIHDGIIVPQEDKAYARAVMYAVLGLLFNMCTESTISHRGQAVDYAMKMIQRSLS